MTYTLATIGLGNIERVRFSTVERGEVYGIPFAASSSTLVYSFDGVKRNITVSGKFTGAALSTIDTFIDAIDALQDGQQGSGSGYAFATGADMLPLSQSYTVHLEKFTWEWAVEPSQLAIVYTLELIQRA